MAQAVVSHLGNIVCTPMTVKNAGRRKPSLQARCSSSAIASALLELEHDLLFDPRTDGSALVGPRRKRPLTDERLRRLLEHARRLGIEHFDTTHTAVVAHEEIEQHVPLEATLL